MKKTVSVLLPLLTLLAIACRFGAPPPSTPTPTANTSNGGGGSGNFGGSSSQASGPLQACLLRPPVVGAGGTAEAGDPGLGDPYYPHLGNGGYDVQHYHVELDVDMARQHLDGRVRIDAIATQTLGSFNLELAGMQVHRIQVQDQLVEYTRDGVELTLTPTQPVEAGEAFEVWVEYSGRPGEGMDFGSMNEFEVGWGWYPDGEGAYVAAEPSGNSTWMPLNEHPSDKATYSYAITVVKPYMAAANGVLQETIDNGDTRTFVWNSASPMASYLATVGIGRFDIETSTGPNGLLIRDYFEQDIPQETRNDFGRTPEMIALFNELVGPYPFEVTGVIVHDIDFGFALETQTMSVFGSGFTDEYVVAHELAHQWFGNSVGLNCWQDLWLNEGFATYMSALWNEHAYGEQALHDEIRMYYLQVALSGPFAAPPGHPGADDLFNFGVYYRGALALHALRERVGDETFFAILQTYYARFRDSNAVTADFVAVAQEVSGQDLQEFFDAWLYAKDVPDIPEMGLYLQDYR
ncbi:MAG: M1 family metallopeptidase [Anaerolineales bacterium]|nr:M1 family metallopeptidase [Anaerolineales bacterium]